jgi:3-oxoacyl-[acyl-carrier-protein] synthase-3
MDVQPMIFSDGAAATVARRGHTALRWRSTEVRTDGRYAEFFRLDVGGAAAPIGTAAAAGGPPKVRDAWDIMEFFEYDAERFEEYARQLDLQMHDVVELACARAGLKLADVGWLAMLGDNAAAMTGFAALVGTPAERTNLELVLDHGHFGAADQLFCLAEWSAGGRLQPGETIALTSRGRGLHWACTLLEA